jgi:hypothetical protein
MSMIRIDAGVTPSVRRAVPSTNAARNPYILLPEDLPWTRILKSASGTCFKPL